MPLRPGDLTDLVYEIFEVDGYKSKMGDDSDIVVLSFTVTEQAPAQDLVNFIERGYGFVLDADSTTGEQDDGQYRVYVEMERNRHVPENIMDLLDGISKLSSMKEFKFRYYKSFKSLPADLETLTKEIPTDLDTYNNTVTESNMNNFKNFFNKSYLESVKMNDDELIIKKPYADPVGFTVKAFGTHGAILESITDKINMNDFAELIFFTKYIGDYNFTKFGKNTITLENAGHVLVLERLK